MRCAHLDFNVSILIAPSFDLVDRGSAGFCAAGDSADDR